MPTIESDESDILKAYESGQLKSVATKNELTKFKAAVRATAIKNRRMNVRRPFSNLSDIEVKALEEVIPIKRRLRVFCTSMSGCPSASRKMPKPRALRPRNAAFST